MRRARLKLPLAAITAAFLLAPQPASALQPTRPTSAPTPRMGPLAPEGPLKIIVIESTGLVRYKTPDNQNWQMISVGLELPEGVEISTGPRSVVKIMVGDTQQITFDRLGRYIVNKANVENGVIKTEAVMREGRTRFEIDTATREHDAVVRSPSSLLAVRGTVTELYDQPPFAPQAVSYTGAVQFRDAQRLVRLGRRGGRTVRFDSSKNSPAETALASTIVDPRFGEYARTPAEQRLIEQVIAAGGVVGFDEPGGIPIVTGGVPLQFDTDSEFPGPGLNFVLNWTGDANLNLTIALPAFGEIITPVTSLNRGNTGGVTAFDHRGGSTNGGFEVVFYPVNYPGSDCVNPAGGLVTFPGLTPDGRPTTIIPDNPDGTPQQTGTQTYISSIDFLSGNVADVSLKTFAPDPTTGEMVFISEATGTVNGSVSNVGQSTFVFRQVNPAPCLPSADDTAMLLLAKGAVSGNAKTPAANAARAKAPPMPNMATDNCGCDVHVTPPAAVAAPAKKKKKK